MEIKVVIKEKHMVDRFESDKKIWSQLKPVMESDEVKKALTDFSSRMVRLMKVLHKGGKLEDESYEKAKKEETWIRVVKDHMYAGMFEASIDEHFSNFKTWNIATILKKLIIDEVNLDSVRKAITLFELEMINDIQTAMFCD